MYTAFLYLCDIFFFFLCSVSAYFSIFFYYRLSSNDRQKKNNTSIVGFFFLFSLFCLSSNDCHWFYIDLSIGLCVVRKKNHCKPNKWAWRNANDLRVTYKFMANFQKQRTVYHFLFPNQWTLKMCPILSHNYIKSRQTLFVGHWNNRNRNSSCSIFGLFIWCQLTIHFWHGVFFYFAFSRILNDFDRFIRCVWFRHFGLPSTL